MDAYSNKVANTTLDKVIKVVVRGKEYEIKLKHAFELFRKPYLDGHLYTNQPFTKKVKK